MIAKYETGAAGKRGRMKYAIQEINRMEKKYDILSFSERHKHNKELVLTGY